MEGKVCTKCKQWKPLEEYHKKKTSKDGRKSICKECKNEYEKQRWLKKHPKETREGVKKCTKCGVWKPLEEYHKQKTGKYGRVSQCKDCRNKPPKETREGMKKCTKCGEWKLLEEFNKNKKNKDGKQSQCKECINEYGKQRYSEKHPKQIKEVREGMKKCTQCGEWKLLEEYNKDKNTKDGRQYECRECQKERRENNPEYGKQWRKDNPEYYKQRRENNPECYKQRYQNNKEHYKQRYQTIKQNNLQYISSIVEQINPVFKQLNLPVYGYVYMFENVNTGHKYVGQSTLQLKTRYGYEGGIVRGWIKERLEYDTQKFKEELIEEDIVVTEVLDVAFCQYHLDKLEAYYINKYDSYNNGYNNREGNHITDDGIEEFNQILLENNLEFIDGKLIRMKEVV